VKIIDDVRAIGDEALIKYTRKFDKVKLSLRQLKVSQIEISGAYANISPHFVSSLKVVIENVNRFYRKQLRKSWRLKGTEGVVLGENYTPLEKVGVYIPAGTAPLVSTVYMTVLPAKLAGVKKIVLISPPDKNGYINPHILVVADLLKVDEIYRVGGAQGVAALAYGTKTIPRVDKIVGPGNVYVSEAKRQVFGKVDIDMIAGPTELVIIANRFSDPKFIVADLRAQAELVTENKPVIDLSDSPTKTHLDLNEILPKLEEIKKEPVSAPPEMPKPEIKIKAAPSFNLEPKPIQKEPSIPAYFNQAKNLEKSKEQIPDQPGQSDPYREAPI
jgi:histidinol dehydrogenase